MDLFETLKAEDLEERRLRQKVLNHKKWSRSVQQKKYGAS
jgi:hypothetical protein